MTLAEFLLARIDEDERDARAAVDDDSYRFEAADHITRWDPARVLAECEAKRRILTWVAEQDVDAPLDDGHWEGHGSDERWIRDVDPLVLRLLTAPYADHPDFDASWAVGGSQ